MKERLFSPLAAEECKGMSQSQRREENFKVRNVRNECLEKEFATLFAKASDDDLMRLAKYEKEQCDYNNRSLQEIFSALRFVRKSAREKNYRIATGIKAKNYFRKKHLVK